MIIEFIDAQHRCGYRIAIVVRALGMLGITFSERSYRRARRRGPSARDVTDAGIVEAMLATRRPCPKAKGEVPRERFYGRRKMTRWLRKQGHKVSFCQVDRLMRQEGLHGLRRGKTPVTTRRSSSHEAAGDLVERNFTAAVPDQLWIADMTYVQSRAGCCYTAFVVDVFSQRILGWAIATTMRTRLVQDALSMAIWQRQRHGRSVDGLVHHSDKGSQYTSLTFTETLYISGIAPSTGSVGDSYDNALMESINGLYKNECIRPEGPILDLVHAEYATAGWVDWYNNERLHSTLNYATPNEHEQAHYDRLIPVLQPEAAHTT